MAVERDESSKACGWESDLPTFEKTKPRVIRTHLEGFVRDASPEQISAWDDSIPDLQCSR
jgi:hypothetical protein